MPKQENRITSNDKILKLFHELLTSILDAQTQFSETTSAIKKSIITEEDLKIKGAYPIDSIDQLAKYLRKSRKNQKITIEKLALFADLSRDSVLRFESGKTDIRISNLLKLFRLCNMKLFVLFDDK